MGALDAIEFSQAFLTTLFLGSLSALILNFLAALSKTSQSPLFSSYLENLRRHNPFQQWMAERQLARNITRARLRALDERTGAFLTAEERSSLVCPNRKWLLLSVVYALIYVLANIAGALIIVWQENVAVATKTTGPTLYPAFPVNKGQNLMELRGNCKWTMVKGSGSVEKAGFAIYQLCVDVFPHSRGEKLFENEIRAVSRINGTKFWKMVWNLETVTQHGVDEDWRVSQGNEDRLEEAREERDYLEECDRECLKHFHGRGEEFAMIQQALKEVGMVVRTLRHYDLTKPNFEENEVLKDRKTRLKTEAWITMLGVTLVAWLWTSANLIGSDEETDFAIATRMLRANAESGPTTFESILRPGVMLDSGFIVGKRSLPKRVVDNLAQYRNKKRSGKVDFKCKEGNPWIKSSDIDMIDEEAKMVVLKVAELAYGVEHKKRVREGMIFVAHRLAEDDESDESDDCDEDSNESVDGENDMCAVHE